MGARNGEPDDDLSKYSEMQVAGVQETRVGAAGCKSDRCYNEEYARPPATLKVAQIMSPAFTDLASAGIGKSSHKGRLSFAQNRFWKIHCDPSSY